MRGRRFDRNRGDETVADGAFCLLVACLNLGRTADQKPLDAARGKKKAPPVTGVAGGALGNCFEGKITSA
jgi:hypothetical protein